MKNSMFDHAKKEKLTEEELLRILDKNHRQAITLNTKLNQLKQLSIEVPTIVYYQEEKNQEEKRIEKDEDPEEIYSFEDEINFYYVNLQGASKQEIKNLLPSKRNPNYQNILLRLKLESIKNLRSIKELEEEFSDLGIDELKEIKEVVEKEYTRIHIIDEKLFQKDEKKEEKVTNKLVFVPMLSGNIRVLDELANIPQEYYESFLSLFSSIQNGSFKNVKYFGSTNSKIAGISEVRDLGSDTRVVFDRIGKDTYAIITAFIKKTQKSKGYKDQLTRKIAGYKSIRSEIKENLHNEDYLLEQQYYQQELWKMLENTPKEKEGKNLCKKK